MPRLPQLRNKHGQFKRGWSLNDKGYPRYTSGPYRNQYVHRVKMALSLGRPLRRDEDVHHVDRNRANFRLSNLRVLSHAEHGYVSALQHWYMKKVGQSEARQWSEYFKEDYTDDSR